MQQPLSVENSPRRPREGLYLAKALREVFWGGIAEIFMRRNGAPRRASMAVSVPIMAILVV